MLGSVVFCGEVRVHSSTFYLKWYVSMTTLVHSVMVEGSAVEVPEEKICEAVKLAFEEVRVLESAFFE